ncbi:hypothetical protein OF83DRAFT_1250170 [Amylostereum chailletii]|nr:hypothetical protein OF83DRAFT_1250170 [Amylostereum chailletii]
MSPSPPRSSDSTPKQHDSSRDAALRKKKNADAQAAFRARRANYIATLEETVTNLEAVVLQLQDSCREARTEANELRQENIRLKQAGRERDSFWRTLWQTRKGESLDGIPPLPAVFGPPMYPPTSSVSPHHVSAAPSTYSDGHVSYSSVAPSPTMTQHHYAPTGPADYPLRSPTLSYPPSDNERVPHDSRPHNMSSQRVPAKYPQYSGYPPPSASRDASSWPQPVAQSSSSGGDSGGAGSGGSCHSPTFGASPNVASTSDLTYNQSYPAVEDPKIPTTLDAPYMFTTSRSPTSTPPSSHSPALTTPFPFAFPDGSTPQDRAEYNYRRPPTSHAPEVTLHGGIADISTLGHGSDGVRYRLGSRRAEPAPDRSMFPALPAFGSSEGFGTVDDAGEEPTTSYSRLRPRRAASRGSRSPSPGGVPMSGTLAVIKAQAFGALRRTRGRKRGADDVAKVAMEALEARGIGMGVSTGAKRQRTRYEDDDDS